MTSKKIFIIILLSLPGITFNAYTQADDDTEESKYHTQIRELISFLKFSLNTLGNQNSNIREKEVIINESYQKLFADSEVQIEDDLTQGRSVVTNKDVQAYLKDVDFFFKNASFDFEILEITRQINEKGQLSFVVELNRLLNGVTISGNEINNTRKRFIEFNLDEESQSLKIASIYTEKINEEEDLMNWWHSLSFEWKSILKSRIGLADSVSINDLKNLTEIKELDVSGSNLLVELSGLVKLTELRKLDLSNTRITDILPVRNLTRLKELDISYTKIKDLSPLKYASELEILHLDHTEAASLEMLKNSTKLKVLTLEFTPVADLSGIENLNDLGILHLRGTGISSLNSLENLNKLYHLDFSETAVSDITPVASMDSLEIIEFDNTKVDDLEPLRSLKNIREIHMDSTGVARLTGLENMPSLAKIYCDYTGINKQEAESFMKSNPDAVVIFESVVLKEWWQGLSMEWKNALKAGAGITYTPKEEDLVRITQVKSLDISGMEKIYNLDPVEKLEELEILKAGRTNITSLAPLDKLHRLKVLDLAYTHVDDLTPISAHENMEILNIEFTAVSSIVPVETFNLKRLYCDGTGIPPGQIKSFIRDHPATLVVYKTKEMKDWWGDLSDPWKNVFERYVSDQNKPSREDFAKIALLKSLEVIERSGIRSLEPLLILEYLEKLTLLGVMIDDLSLLRHLKDLRHLECIQMPVEYWDFLQYLNDLVILNIKDTRTSSLNDFSHLSNLEVLNCSGTQVKNLKPLAALRKLRYLDISNTRVNTLKHITGLPQIKTVVVFNTRIPEFRIDDFKEAHPDTEIVYY